jgi:hypothetical protein
VNDVPQSRNRSRKVCLLLTATVDPSGVTLERSDPRARFNDYRWALERWARHPGIDRLIFVENSGYDIEELRAAALAVAVRREALEFLSFYGQDFPRSLGKGYGETLNLEHVLANSRFLAEDDCLILRVNGRNYVENIDAFVRALTSTDILCDFKQLLTWGDGRILGGTVEFIAEYVCRYGRETNDAEGYYFEHTLARAMHRAMADGLRWAPFPEPPLISGFSGTSNQSLADGRLRRMGRKAQHRVKLRMLRL